MASVPDGRTLRLFSLTLLAVPYTCFRNRAESESSFFNQIFGFGQQDNCYRRSYTSHLNARYPFEEHIYDSKTCPRPAGVSPTSYVSTNGIPVPVPPRSLFEVHSVEQAFEKSTRGTGKRKQAVFKFVFAIMENGSVSPSVPERTTLKQLGLRACGTCVRAKVGTIFS